MDSSTAPLAPFFLPFLPNSKDAHSSPPSCAGSSGAEGKALTVSSAVSFLFFFLSFLPVPHTPQELSASLSFSGSGRAANASSFFSSPVSLPFFFLSFLLTGAKPQLSSSAGLKSVGPFIPRSISVTSWVAPKLPKSKPLFMLAFFLFLLLLPRDQGLLSPSSVAESLIPFSASGFTTLSSFFSPIVPVPTDPKSQVLPHAPNPPMPVLVLVSVAPKLKSRFGALSLRLIS